MATAGEIIVDALQDLIVQASESEINADEAQTAIRFMNNYMASIAAFPGINLGYTKIANLADTVTIPEGAYRGLIANLAIALAPQYNVPLTNELVLAAKSGQSAMLALSFNIGKTQYPNTLPRGSGNNSNNNRNTSPFYCPTPENIITEGNRNIDLESSTEL